MRLLISFVYVLFLVSACNSDKNSNERKAALIDSQENSLPNTSLNDSSLNKLAITLLEADSVFLIGHSGRIYKRVNEGVKIMPIPPIVINGQLNKAILKKKLRITGKDLDTLVHILGRPIDTTIIINQNKCVFDPHHSILLYKNMKVSYVELCFKCQDYEASDGLEITLNLNSEEWEKLESLFISKNVRFYEFKR